MFPVGFSDPHFEQRIPGPLPLRQSEDRAHSQSYASHRQYESDGGSIVGVFQADPPLCRSREPKYENTRNPCSKFPKLRRYRSFDIGDDSPAFENETDVRRIARFDAERNERDRELRRRYDYNRSAPSHREYLERTGAACACLNLAAEPRRP
jgi:hypothetical protein